MKPTLGPGDRYWYIMAHARGTKRRNRLVQQLVAEAFLGPAEGRIVRHLNNVGTDNRQENLAYGSNSENQMDRVLHGTSNRGTASGHNKLSEEDVMSVLELRKKGLPMQRIATEVGCSRKNVHKILVGETWSWLTGIQPQ
jgi:DNA-binding NarL/FixJ family response regulator